MVATVAACISMETMRRERIADVLTNDASKGLPGYFRK
jgi:hypothetical protein